MCLANSHKPEVVMFPYQLFHYSIQRKTKALVGLIWLRIGSRFRFLQTHYKPSHCPAGAKFLDYLRDYLFNEDDYYSTSYVRLKVSYIQTLVNISLTAS
jgi:hypothetical protein